MKAGARKDPVRDTEILRDREAGKGTFAQFGARYGISGDRARQIYCRMHSRWQRHGGALDEFAEAYIAAARSVT